MADFRESLPLREQAGFWAVFAAVPVVMGGIFLGIGLAEFSKPGARTSLWTYGWFRVGLVFETVGFVVLIWALVLYLAHRHAENHVAAWRAAGPSRWIAPVPPLATQATSRARPAPAGVPDFSEEIERFYEIERNYNGTEAWASVIDQWIEDVRTKLERWNPRHAQTFVTPSVFTVGALAGVAAAGGRPDILSDPQLKRLHLARNRLSEISEQ